MSPANKNRSRKLFSTTAALVLGLQWAPESLTLSVQAEEAPSPLIVQAHAQPIQLVSKRSQMRKKNKAAKIEEKEKEKEESEESEEPTQPPALLRQPYQQQPMQVQQAPQYQQYPQQQYQQYPQQYQQPQQFQTYQQPQMRVRPQQNPKTEVELELERIYQENGRPAPDMADSRNQQPNPNPPETMVVAPIQYAPQPVQQPAPQPVQPPAGQKAQPASAPKKKSVFSKWFGKDDVSTNAPVETPYIPPVAATPVTPPAQMEYQPSPQVAGTPNYGQIFVEPVAPALQQPQFVPQPQYIPQPQYQQAPQYVLQPQYVEQPQYQQPPQFAQQPQDQQDLDDLDPEAENEEFDAPVLEEPAHVAAENGLPQIDFNAPLETPVLDDVELGQEAPLPVARKPARPADPFSDDALFPQSASDTTEMNTVAEDATEEVVTEEYATDESATAEIPAVEAEAQPAEETSVAVEEEPVDENPYSGLTLDDDPFSNPSALIAASATPREIPLNDLGANTLTSETSPPALMIPLDASTAGAEEPPLVVESAETPKTARLTPVPRSGNSQTRAKQEMIAARKGLRGLKGFCPVVLREDRDLVDAHSQFRAVYNSKTYYLSSSQAVTAFHSDPARYAPAARGCDVIHLAITGEEIEGTLDYAVWFKGRLYLFSSAETMDTFVSSPSSHDTLD